MFGLLKKLFRLRKGPREQPDPDALAFEHWEADFTKPRHVRFVIKSENTYDANLRKGALVLGLKKSHCLAWVEDPLFRYGDLVLRGRMRLDSRGGYAAAGCLFRMVDDLTYYSLLISSKSYFRLDVVRNGSPQTLIGWTELPGDAPGDAKDDAKGDGSGEVLGEAEFLIIAYGSHIVIGINGNWAAELSDATIPAGRIGFALASYQAPPGEGRPPDYVAEAFLESLSLDSRVRETEQAYAYWTGEVRPPPRSRFRLAETFAAMGQAAPALIQIKRGWEDPRYPRAPGELLLAGKLAMDLGLFAEAEEYIAQCRAVCAAHDGIGSGSPVGKEAAFEAARLLYVTERFAELETYGEEAAALLPDNAALWTLLGHAAEGRGNYVRAAEAYDRAFELDPADGTAALRAAGNYELADRPGEALDRYLRGGRAFLTAGDYGNLGELIPRLLALGGENSDAHGLAGKWAFGIEDWSRAAGEFGTAEKLRLAQPSPPPPDPAISYLRGLLLLRGGKRQQAQDLLEEAAALAPDYPLFRFKAAENRFLLSGDPRDPRLLADLEAALSLSPEDGWVRNFAAQICLSRGDLDEAAAHLEIAGRLLGDAPDIRVNQGVLFYLQGFMDKALEVLSPPDQEDPQGVMANCAGNLLVRAGRFEDADPYYRRALALAPDNTEYYRNRASCLIELGLYGEAGETLERACGIAPSPDLLELAAYVAAKKGEYPRAEAAHRAALDLDPRHVPSLVSLGWVYANSGRWDELSPLLTRLEALSLDQEAAARREELRTRWEEATTRSIPCARCGRTWRVPRSPPPVRAIRLFAMPPDDMPAGTCPECGNTYCIGCAKTSLDPQGRFLCPQCKKPLKLMHGGLKKLVADWAARTIPPKEKR
jgi:tetratricopeptide (TPR) repeat protein